jgi:FAD/FMN-containing dehydrogenase
LPLHQRAQAHNSTTAHQKKKGATDLQERKYNVVFRGIKESCSTDGLERKENDMKEIASMVHSVDETVDIRGAVVAARRLGKKEEGKDFCPLLVKVKSQDLREALIRMNGSLKEVNRQKGTGHRIDPDMTKEQMARLDKMWTETREKKNGVKLYVVGKENPILRSRELSEEEKENAKE